MTHPPLARRLSGAARQLPAPLVRAGMLFALAIFIVEGIAYGIFARPDWTLEDARAYLTSFASNPGGSQSLLFISPVAWAAVAVAALGVAVLAAFARKRYWVATSTAAMAVLPRFFLYDLTHLLVGTAGRRDSRE